MHIYIYSMTITFKFEHLEHLKISFLFQTKNILLYQDVVTTYCLQAIVNNAALSLSEIKKKCFFFNKKIKLHYRQHMQKVYSLDQYWKLYC